MGNRVFSISQATLTGVSYSNTPTSSISWSTGRFVALDPAAAHVASNRSWNALHLARPCLKSIDSFTKSRDCAIITGTSTVWRASVRFMALWRWLRVCWCNLRLLICRRIGLLLILLLCGLRLSKRGVRYASRRIRYFVTCSKLSSLFLGLCILKHWLFVGLWCLLKSPRGQIWTYQVRDLIIMYSTSGLTRCHGWMWTWLIG